MTERVTLYLVIAIVLFTLEGACHYVSYNECRAAGFSRLYCLVR